MLIWRYPSLIYAFILFILVFSWCSYRILSQHSSSARIFTWLEKTLVEWHHTKLDTHLLKSTSILLWPCGGLHVGLKTAPAFVNHGWPNSPTLQLHREISQGRRRPRPPGRLRRVHRRVLLHHSGKRSGPPHHLEDQEVPQAHVLLHWELGFVRSPSRSGLHGKHLAVRSQHL